MPTKTLKNSISSFNYDNIQKYQDGGKKTVRKVSIRNGKGYKSVICYKNGKLHKITKKNLKKEHVKLIKMGKFIPGLFKNCIEK